ncbi:MAG: hypothetical protein IT450_13595 [Phycisphaerales bacterium]|nr:hypothetical protein [Phycisphaerales bacterium]
MGLITDFIAARAADASAILESGYPYDGRPFLQAKNVDILEIAGLFCEINPEESSTDVFDEFSCLAENDETWVHLIPDRVTRAIAEIPDERVGIVGRAWQNSDDRPAAYSEAQWLAKREALPEFLAKLVDFARHARADHLDVLVYTCL